MKNKSVYICGPMQDIEQMNKESFYGAEMLLKSAGYQNISNPIRLMALRDENNWNEILKVCLQAMLACDMVVLLPGWQQSKSATLERKIAQTLGITVVLLKEVVTI